MLGHENLATARGHVHERAPAAAIMVNVALIEALAESLCGAAALLFTFIATMSRSPALERMAQGLISAVLVLCAVVLWWLSLAGGTLWGSNYLPKPLSLFCLLLALAARMNIKGTNISFGANPHNIGRSDDEE